MAAPRTLALVLFAALAAYAGTEGTFRGTIVEPSKKSDSDQGWIYVQGRNQMLRRVSTAQAKIVFSQEVPLELRGSRPTELLVAGTEVRVTAEQDSSGEWRAKIIEILRLPAHPTAAAAKI